MSVSQHMSRALSLAARARHQTSPNPMVGAVVVRNGTVVGEGFHHRAGGPHAEVVALRRAGDQARGGTMYVSLEPCAHVGRTPPCVTAILEAGVRKVVAAMRDPDRRVSGGGITQLRAAGVQVEVGEGRAQAEKLNRRWLGAARQRRPYLALKYAASLDGKIATSSGESRWITGPAARAEAHRLRRAYDAVAVGANTVLRDDPELTVRGDGQLARGRQPLRVVVDGKLRVSPKARMFGPRVPGRTLVVTSPAAYRQRAGRFEAQGVWVEPLGSSSRIDVDLILRYLAEQGVGSLLVEGGGELIWQMVASGAVDRVYAFFGPSLVGGRRAPTPVGGEGYSELAQALRLELVGVRRLGPDILLEAVPA